jgi:hypothetical protein
MLAYSKNCPFVVNTKIYLKNITTTSDKNGVWRVMFWLRCATVPSNVVLMFLISIVLWTPNGSFWGVPVLHSVSDMMKNQSRNTLLLVDKAIIHSFCDRMGEQCDNGISSTKCNNWISTFRPGNQTSWTNSGIANRCTVRCHNGRR